MPTRGVAGDHNQINGVGVRVKIDVGVAGLVGFDDEQMVKFNWRTQTPRPGIKY